MWVLILITDGNMRQIQTFEFKSEQACITAMNKLNSSMANWAHSTYIEVK